MIKIIIMLDNDDHDNNDDGPRPSTMLTRLREIRAPHCQYHEK